MSKAKKVSGPYTLDTDSCVLTEHHVLDFDKDIMPRFDELAWQTIFKAGTNSRNEAVRERCKKHRMAHTKVYKPTKEEKLRLLSLIATWASIDNEDYGTYPITDDNAIDGGIEWWLDEMFGTGKVYGL